MSSVSRNRVKNSYTICHQQLSGRYMTLLCPLSLCIRLSASLSAMSCLVSGQYLKEKKFHYVNISYPVDQCISPVCSRCHQTLEKNVLSWALTGSVVSIRQVSSQHPVSPLRVCAYAHFLFLFGAIVFALNFIQEKLYGYFE